MRTKLFTFLISFVVLFAFTNLFGQSAQNEVDVNAQFKVNPFPSTVHNSEDGGQLEEIFGLNQNMFGPSGNRGRGNIYFCTTARKLVEHRFYLNPTAAANMWFVVYEGVTDTGNYNLVHSVNVPNQGPGEGWYSSGTIDFDFEVGKYYMIYTQWDVDANYWNENPVAPYPVPASFGELVSGVGWNWAPLYGDPPPAVQNVQEGFVDPVAYYQTLVTDDILTAPLAPSNVSATPQGSTTIDLTWQDNSDNEDGFLIQRKLGVGGTFADLATVGADVTFFQDLGLVPNTEYCYRVRAFNGAGNSAYSSEDCATTAPNSVEDEFSGIPSEFGLFDNFPNPFNPSTTIYYAVPEVSFVELKVFDALGNEITTLVSETKEAGYHNISFDAADYNSGVYFYQLQTGNFVETKKMILMK